MTVEIAPGQTVYARFSPKHRGPGGTFWIGIGIFPAGVLHSNPNSTDFGSDVWIGGWYDIPYHASLTAFSIEVSGAFPGGFISGTYDTWKIVQSESPVVRRDAGEPPATGEFGEEAADWDDDVFRVIPVPPVPTYPVPSEYTEYDAETGYWYYIDYDPWGGGWIYWFDPATGDTGEIYGPLL